VIRSTSTATRRGPERSQRLPRRWELGARGRQAPGRVPATLLPSS